MNVDGQYNPKDVECISVENLEVLPSGADWQSRHLESERRKAEIRDRIHKQAEQGQKTAKDYFRPAKPTPSIYDSDLKRVAVYARVSTSSEEAIMFTPKPQEYTDPLTGEMKKKQMKFFPDAYKNRIGKSYNDYIADHQMNMFEDFIGYQGSAVLDEPVREEDSFSKESMSQESEISENILLPDLVKQSESIEQQSGEIAERGMPT